MACKFPRHALCRKSPVRSLKPFLLLLNGMIATHNSCVFTVYMSGYKYLSYPTSNSGFTCFVDWRFFRSRSRCPKVVAIIIGICFNNVWLLSTGEVSNFRLLIAFRYVLGVVMKKHPCRYWISSVFILSLVIITCDLFLHGFEMGMSHNSSDFSATLSILVWSLW